MTSVIYMPHVPFTSPHVAPLELAHFPANVSAPLLGLLQTQHMPSPVIRAISQIVICKG